MPVTDREKINAAITGYVSVQFLDDTELSELDQETPLLEWGVLNSMNTSTLLAYIRQEFGVIVPPAHITWRHLQNLRAITDMVHELSTQAEHSSRA
ncbi:hypothetical protein GCM10009677_44770 [Sphaerisporangium rubeum]|uniref:Acyl carrier protein n=1 Tax=Sphaerisporangium rubeum TaxID=321317 RepID=A0A7X0I9M2_9ACTN|nr:acyl carrier protein [Sphaerisporangium rubeum]MBB6471010.1 acyl carrier protein [Sphaerisporangium rubeum]